MTEGLPSPYRFDGLLNFRCHLRCHLSLLLELLAPIVEERGVLFQVPHEFERARVTRFAEKTSDCPPRFALLHDTPRRLSLSAGLAGLPAAAMTAPTFSVALRSGSENKCE
jgi:hypothetical protein